MATSDSPHDLLFLHKLSPSEQEQLQALLQRARRSQEAEHQTAIEQALSHVPALLRGTVRKMLSD